MHCHITYITCDMQLTGFYEHHESIPIKMRGAGTNIAIQKRQLYDITSVLLSLSAL